VEVSVTQTPEIVWLGNFILHIFPGELFHESVNAVNDILVKILPMDTPIEFSYLPISFQALSRINPVLVSLSTFPVVAFEVKLILQGGIHPMRSSEVA